MLKNLELTSTVRRILRILAPAIVITALGTELGNAQPLDVGAEKQVFLDGRFIEQAQGVELVVNRPRPTGEKLLEVEYPWEDHWIGDYLSVLQEGDQIRMWYDSSDRRGMTGVGYAFSTDGGRTWIKPKIGIVEYQGSRENNLVLTGVHGIHIFRNRPDAPKDEKYCLFSGQPNRLYVSEDGFHWKPKGKTPFLNLGGHSGLDSQNVMFWDSRIHKYVAYPRLNVGRLMRTVGRSESPRLGDFPDPIVMLARDDRDPPGMDFYTSATIHYPFAADAYYMFPAAYHHWPSPPNPGNDGPLDLQFAASRDGAHWLRPDRRPIIRRGLDGTWDGGCMYAGYGLSRDGHELSLYYTVHDITHGAYVLRGYLGGVITRAVYRLDGFISADSGYQVGSLTTPPLIFAGDRLEINFDASAGGWVRVELLGPRGQAFPGFTQKEADKLVGNSLARLVTWAGKQDLSAWKGKPVKLRFVMRDAKLYAFEFPTH